LQEKPGKFTGPFLFSVTLVCIMVGGLYMAKNKLGPFAPKAKVTAQATKKASKDGDDSFLPPGHVTAPKKKVSSPK
jgi:hypothetical protein